MIHTVLIHNGSMKLKTYLRKHGITMVSFGRRLNPPVSAGKVNHWLRGTRRVSLEDALQIEVLTEGDVSLRELVNQTDPELDAKHV